MRAKQAYQEKIEAEVELGIGHCPCLNNTFSKNNIKERIQNGKHAR
jgi:hypothetical protein